MDADCPECNLSRLERGFWKLRCFTKDPLNRHGPFEAWATVGPRKIVKKPIDVPQVQYVDKIVRSSEQASPWKNLGLKGFGG